MKNISHDRRRLTALAQIAKSEYGAVLKDWFEESLAEQRVLNEDGLKGQELFMGMGEAVAMRSFLKELEEAPEAAAKMQGV